MLSPNELNAVSTLDPPCRQKPPWGRSRANVLKWISFHWVNPVLSIGKKRELVMDDVDDIDKSDTTQHLVIKFLQAWNDQLKQNPNNPSLVWAIIHTIGFKVFGPLCIAITLLFIGTLASVTCLQEILKYIENPNDYNDHGVSFEHSCGFAVGIFVCALFVALLNHHSFYSTARLGILIRQVLTGVILYKTLKIGSGSVLSSQIMNLMSSDAPRFEMFLRLILFAIISALVIFPALIFLCYRIGSFHPFWGLLLIVVMYVV